MILPNIKRRGTSGKLYEEERDNWEMHRGSESRSVSRIFCGRSRIRFRFLLHACAINIRALISDAF